MKAVLKYAGVAILLITVGIQFIRPARTNPPIDPSDTLPARAQVPADVAAILDRGCRDCHSNQTRWPWYSNVAPVSWFVIDHVKHGRSHFNYSEWSKYSAAEASKLLKNSCELTRKGAMPMASYLWMHRSARLSAADVDAVCGWALASP
jgi:Haem-binding domain